MEKVKDILIKKVNNSCWWHVTPLDPDAYKKRGKFLASAYGQAEIYGRPNDSPEKVAISNPIYGFSEIEILKRLFPEKYKNLYSRVIKEEDKNWYNQRINLDARMFRKAKRLGHDAIVLLSPQGRDQLKRNRKPSSMELNLLNV